MRDKVVLAIKLFGWISIMVALIQIVIGRIDYNSFIDGFDMSYKYFAVGFFFLGLSIIVELLEEIDKKMKR